MVSAATMMLVASAAFGAADSLKGGSTTLGPLKLPKKVTLATKGGATKSGKTVTLPISGGSLDPTNGTGPVQDGGTIQLKKGKKKVTLTSIVTTFGSGGSISATLSGKKGKKSAKSTQLATIAGGTVGRAGFGGTVTDAVAKLTKKGAKALNTALGGGFKAGKLGTISTSTVPLNVTVTSATSSTTLDTTGLPGCVGPATCTTFAGKLIEDGISSTPSNGATQVGTVLTFTPQTGGSIAPDCTTGTLTGSQGTVTLARGPASVAQANPNDDFSGKAVTFEATATGLGSLGRAAATNLTVNTCSADAATKTITVSATQTVNANAAAVVNAVFGLNGTSCPSGSGPPQNCAFTGGEPVGTSEYTIHTQ